MNCFLLLIVSAVAYAQMPNAEHDNYYEPNRDSRVGQRTVTQIKAGGTAVPDPRLDQIGNRLAAHSPEFKYQFFAFDVTGQPSMDTAPAGAFPGDWRRLQIDEALAVAGGMIFITRARLLSRDDSQLSAILAHAIGHVALRHSTRSMTRGELDQVEAQAASRAMPEEAAQRLRAIPLNRYAFDRACELEADAYALKLLRDSGLDPAVLLTYLRNAAACRKNKDLSVYPLPAERVDANQKAIVDYARSAK